MNRPVRSSPLGYFGLLGGLVIAVGLPWLVLALGSDMSPRTRVVIIILALVVGAVLAGASVIVGIAVPSAMRHGRLDIGAVAGCCEPAGNGDACCDTVESSGPARSPGR